MSIFQASERKLALVTIDLMGFTRGAAGVPAIELARFLDAYYRGCAEVIGRYGGRIVKFMGDGCFAVFDESRAADAVSCVRELQPTIEALRGGPFPTRGPAMGSNVHLAVVAEAELGAESDRRYDVVGEGVNHLFRMGGGAGIRISEPVYRALPNDQRGPWRKQRPPAAYVFEP
jgi:adenylate cyclase